MVPLLVLGQAAAGASSDSDAGKGIRKLEQTDVGGGTRNEGRINVVMQGIRRAQIVTKYGSLGSSGATSRWMEGGARGAFLANNTSKEQETDDKQDDCVNAAPTDGGTAGNPVVLYTGNKVEPELDFASNGEMGLYLQRTYNHHWSATGLFGRHWLSNLDYSLVYSDAQNIL